MSQCEYRSMLRVPSIYADAELGNILLAKLDEGGFDSVMFFNTPTHDVVCEKRHLAYAEQLRWIVEEVKKRGIAVGIDILSTVGHHMEAPDPGMDGMDFFVDDAGWESRGTLCPASEKNLRAVARQYQIYAELDIDFIYIDDDLDYHCGCFCSRCLNELEQRYATFSQNGLTVGRENLLSLMHKADKKVRKKVFLQWLDYYRFRVNRIYKTIEQAVHSVKPSLTLGMMPCVVGFNGCGQDEWSETLSAGSGQLLVRPGGGLYTDFRPDRVMEKANNIGRQMRFIPQYAQAQSEIENFPQQCLRKSVKFTLFEALAYLGAGCTGTSYNILPWSGKDSIEEADRFFGAIRKMEPYAKRIASVFGRNPSSGIGCYWDKETFAAFPEEGIARSPFEEAFYSIGLPVCYDPENTCVFLLNSFSAEWLSDEILEKLLRKGVMMDAFALEILNRRGYGRYTGFKRAEKIERNAVEHQLDHKLNAGGCLRDAHLEFSLNGHSEFDKTDPAYTIEATDVRAEALSVLRGYEGKERGISCGIFENEWGGRVCVAGYAPFTWCYSLSRTVQLKNVFRWLSKDSLPGYIESCEKVALWPRTTVQGETGVVLLNLSFDSQCNLKVLLKGFGSKALYVSYDDEMNEMILPCEARPDGYTEVVLPSMKSLSAGFIVLK